MKLFSIIALICLPILASARVITAADHQDAPSATNDHSDQTDRFGGTKSIRTKPTGFFRVERFGKRWLFVTPEGHGYFALGANHVGKYLDQQADEMGLLKKHAGSRDQAASFLTDRMKSMGLNAGEAYAPIAPELKPHLPWVANFRFPERSKFAFDIFDPDVQQRLRQSVLDQCVEIRDDPMVLGIAFCDLPIWDDRRVAFFESLPESAPGKKKLIEYRDAGKTDLQFLAHVADVLYGHLKDACRLGAPNHLFFGERHRLRGTPDEVLRSVGKHVDVFCTQALILSPQRPPEWQIFQSDRYDYEQSLTQKPMIIIDWAAPFSLGDSLQTEKGTLHPELQAANEAAQWLTECSQRPYIIGVFKCQLIGLHANDRWFDGKARRTYLKDDGSDFESRTRVTHSAHHASLENAYSATLEGETWTNLFNGKNLDGWTVHSGTASFQAIDGVIVGTTAPMTQNSFLCTDRTYSDFELELDVWCDKGLNSGIQIRSQIADAGTQVTNTKNPKKPKTITLPKDRVYGYQVEIAKSESGRSGGIYDEARRFIFLDDLTGKPDAQQAFKNDQWNHFRVRCQGDRLQTWVNGIACADVHDTMNRKGIIGLQVHGNIAVTGRVIKKNYEKHEVRFRNLRIRELDLPSPHEHTSFLDSPATIPGRIQSEHYDKGGQGNAYHDSDALNRGSGKLNLKFDDPNAGFRRDEGVDVSFTKPARANFAGDQTLDGDQEPSGSLYLGWTKPGEWIRYTVNVMHPGLYRVSGHVSSGKEHSAIDLCFSGNQTVRAIFLPHTGNAHRWTTTDDLGVVNLAAGIQTMTLRVKQTGGFNIDWLEFTPIKGETQF